MRTAPRSSPFWQRREVTLGLPVPPHAGDRVLPPTFHVLQRTLVRLVTAGDRLLEMAVLRLDDTVCGLSAQLEVARSTELLARHGFHFGSLPFVFGSWGSR